MKRDLPPLSDDVVSKGPHDECGTEFGNVLYADGHSFCFRCNKMTSKPTDGPHLVAARTPGPATPSDLLKPEDYPGAWAEIKERGLKSETLKRYGMFTARYAGKHCVVAPYYDKAGNLTHQKVRLPGKEFLVLKAPGAGGIKEALPFGSLVFGDRFDKRIVVHEGEYDAATGGQAMELRCPCVSLPAGVASAVGHMKANYLFYDRYAEIVLWFDDDEPGRAAMEECAKLFAVGKVKIAKVPGRKDASDCFQAKEPGTVLDAIYGAVGWRPKGIVNAADCGADVEEREEEITSYRYPDFMPELQAMTGGLRPGEVSYHVAGTGVGKSTQIREIVYDLVHRQGLKVGMMSFEDTRKNSQLLLMSIHAGERLQLRPRPVGPEAMEAHNAEMRGLHREVFGGRGLELFDQESAEWSLTAAMSYIRYMAKGLGCVVVVIDPLSFLAALADVDDERKALDLVAATTAKLAKELGIAIIIVHHLRRTSGTPHEEGAPTSLNELRSSGGLAMFATLVVGWERNNQAADEAWRVTQSRVLKPHRDIGRAGLADVLFYGENGRLVKSHLAFPPPGKPDEGDPSGRPPGKIEDY